MYYSAVPHRPRLSVALICSLLGIAGCHTSVKLADAPRPPPAAAGVGNRAPTVKIEGVPEAKAVAGATVTLRANAYDADGDRLTLAWSVSAGTVSNATTPRTVWTAPSNPAAVTITLRVTDAAGATATDTLSVVVSAKP